MVRLLPEGQGSLSLIIYLKDDEGILIPDIEIKLLNTSKKIIETSSTSNSGIVTFNSLTSGDYYIRINKQSGYKVFADLAVTVSGNAEKTVVLERE